MDMALDVLSRWVHILTAIVAVGGLFFLRTVLIPAAEAALDESAHASLRDKVLARWKMVVHISIALLLLSGIFNYVRALAVHTDQPLYHALAGTKMILALVVFVLASGLVGRSPAFEPLRKNRKKWLGISLTLAVVVVLIGGVLRNLPVS